MRAPASELTLCGKPGDRVLDEIREFHGFPAPGVVIGAFMVDWAQEQIGRQVEADAIVETLRCLPDAVQLFTPCTLGNGWLRSPSVSARAAARPSTRAPATAAAAAAPGLTSRTGSGNRRRGRLP